MQNHFTEQNAEPERMREKESHEKDNNYGREM